MTEVDRRNWLTPPGLYDQLNAEFHFDFDPCPYPRPNNFDGLTMPWGHSNYVNPPFTSKDGGRKVDWVKKAIHEAEKGKRVVMILPLPAWLQYLIKANAEIRYAGNVRWISVLDGVSSCNGSRPAYLFIMEG